MNELKNFIKSVLFNKTDNPNSLRFKSLLDKGNIYCKDIIKLTSFLDENCKITERIYCVLNDINENIKCKKENCNNNVNYSTFKTGYLDYCCQSCAVSSNDIQEKIKRTNLERYGVENPSQSKKVQEKVKETNLRKYGKEHYSQTKERDKRVRQTNLERYGVENPFFNEEIKKKHKINIKKSASLKSTKEKRKKTVREKYGCDFILQNKEVRQKRILTNLDKYGTEHPMQSEEIRNRMKETNLERYGVEESLSLPGVREKIKKTNIEKYGHENVFGSKEIQDKIKETNLDRYGSENYFSSEEGKRKYKELMVERYGVDHNWKSKEIRDRIKKTNLEKYGSEYPTRNKKVIKRIKDNIQKTRYGKNYELIISRFNDKEWLIYQNRELKKNLYEISNELGCSSTVLSRIYKRHNIDVIYHNISLPEKEIIDYINNLLQLDILSNNRSLIYLYELDIYIKDFNLAIEFNGLYWHSFNSTVNEEKNKHLNKTILCKEKKVQLLHVFENEWVNKQKQDIWKSIICNKLNQSNKIYARKCKIKEIDSKTSRIFLDNNHLQGNCPSSIKIGLFYNDELVSIMTFGKTRFSKKYQYELIRFANKKFTTVVGGAGKLFKYFIRNYSPESIVSYCDLRYGTGKLYENLGFEYSHTSNPNYYYFLNNENILYNRIMFQKHKLNRLLENFDSNLTESDNMFNNGYRRIWDCGNIVYKYK